MTLENCIEYRRWAESMLNEVVESLKQKHSPAKVKEYWYLKEWINKFDRLVRNFTCWNENHNVHKDGLAELKKTIIITINKTKT